MRAQTSLLSLAHSARAVVAALTFCLALLAAGCEGTPECGAASTCASCLAEDGCNWTGGECASECVMDTDCYGPGNPAAASCPAAGSAAED